MSLSFDKALGVHADALQVRSRRLELLASNLANADTPGYKARDIDFRAALNQAAGQGGVQMVRTHASHLPAENSGPGGEALYRVPNQPSLDGNTVDGQLEQAAFSENAVQYQASLDFLNSRFRGLKAALRGE
ncbi:flagellar basal body rod protein FlgB [Thioalkalivibrio denitrificans]|uniref:Flagellar basal body rod protein FlgB n=1 Tax=Thioalkalivibrio denitrificans TaxID=108003 RepID=A0A1V3NQY3_9GAMM|nr:flagellar basal body rod protein FlgB [Thioalkalivibrio denitrificans]OOG27232.1 flagellar basal body rod protein FlgB [Thioalkalivibrio denitrificans]